jgi:hypothetical protein
VAFSVLCLGVSGGQHLYAGINDTDLDYSASMLKVAAMYAAHELLAAAKRLAGAPAAAKVSVDGFFLALASVFDAQILAAAPADALTAAKQLADKTTGYRTTPSYRKIFTVSGAGSAAGLTVEFVKDFAERMLDMIQNSDDGNAGECIRRLSYTYINAALAKAGFGAAPNFIWLAGDYSKGKNPHAVVTSVNDADVAQATTAVAMMRLFSLVESGTLVAQDKDKLAGKMRDLLTKAAGQSWLAENPPKSFGVDFAKIGYGELKGSGYTYSETLVLNWTDSARDPGLKKLTGQVIICWQNVQTKKVDLPMAQFGAISGILDQAYAALL